MARERLRARFPWASLHPCRKGSVVPALAYVNGRVGPLKSAVVPLLDRGFLLADGAYEVLRTYGGRPFELQAHLSRLETSLRGLRLPAPMTQERLARLIKRLLDESGYREARIYVQVTRGVARRQHAFPKRVRPTLVIYVERMPRPPAAPGQRGVAVITVPDPRWRACDLKTIALLPNVLAKQQAVEAGAHEAIFVAADGTVREGASANVFIVRGRTLRTHPVGPEILAGVSRQLVLDLGREAGLDVREGRFRRAALYAADEVFLSSTLQEILPVVRVDGRRIGDGRPGPMTRDLWRRFRARTQSAAGGATPGEGRRPRA